VTSRSFNVPWFATDRHLERRVPRAVDDAEAASADPFVKAIPAPRLCRLIVDERGSRGRRSEQRWFFHVGERRVRVPDLLEQAEQFEFLEVARCERFGVDSTPINRSAVGYLLLNAIECGIVRHAAPAG
jgi:hypothetical protein